MTDKQLIAIMAAIIHAPRLAEQGLAASEHVSAKAAYTLFQEVQSLIEKQAGVK
jgi:hypothetical protein